VIIATGPLTSDALSADVAALVGSKHLYFYDAISPIVLSESIDRSKVFRASRWGRSLPPKGGNHENSNGRAENSSSDPVASAFRRKDTPAPACGLDDGEGDYLNCPFTREEYQRFYDALIAAEKAPLHEFDKATFFEGCLPIEVMASRGVDTLRFGPMKPVGLPDPRTGDHFSLVGFQTQMKWGEQARVLKLIPGLEHAEFVRFGMIHRNTYVNSPTVLHETWQTRMRPDLFFAGQMSGVEGYVESAASGLIAGRNAAALVLGERPSAPPRTTALGALAYYASHADPKHYVPSNISFGLIPPLEGRIRSKKDRNTAISERALGDLARWEADLKTVTI
jgi:methylenetetrahydrofolate--tRNA-(uracil-5-)-methyltransferase